MTREETAKILSSLRAAFPNGYRNLDKADYLAIIEVWLDQFKSDSYEDVSRAVRNLIATSTSEWPPVIGAVKAEMAKTATADVPTVDEAWLAIRKACRNSLYHSDREFAKLHPVVQSVVGGAWQLKEWANYTDAEMEKVAYNFKKSYKEVREMGMIQIKLPEDIKPNKVVTDLARRLVITDG